MSLGRAHSLVDVEFSLHIAVVPALMMIMIIIKTTILWLYDHTVQGKGINLYILIMKTS